MYTVICSSSSRIDHVLNVVTQTEGGRVKRRQAQRERYRDKSKQTHMYTARGTYVERKRNRQRHAHKHTNVHAQTHFMRTHPRTPARAHSHTHKHTHQPHTQRNARCHTHTQPHTHTKPHTHTHIHTHVAGGVLTIELRIFVFPRVETLFFHQLTDIYMCETCDAHLTSKKHTQRTPLQRHLQTHTLHCHYLHAYNYARHTRKYTRASTYANTRACIPPPPTHTPARAAATRSALVVLPVPGVPVIKTLGNCPTLCAYAHQPKIPCFSG